MKVLGIDYGDKHIGLALGDYELKVAMPRGEVSSLVEVCELLEAEDISKVVIGLPLNLNRKETEQTRRVRRFAKNFKVPVLFVDETYTSRGAGNDHSKAAAQILQTHFDRLDRIDEQDD